MSPIAVLASQNFKKSQLPPLSPKVTKLSHSSAPPEVSRESGEWGDEAPQRHSCVESLRLG